jgi:hypothetical protein
MPYGRRITAAGLAVCVVAVTLVIALRPRIRATPQAVRVDYSGPANAKLVVVHLRDYHFVPRELCEIEGIPFDEVLKIAASVQESQLAIARELVRSHSLRGVYSEGVSEKSLPAVTLRVNVIKDLAGASLGGLPESIRHIVLAVGTPGRLWAEGTIEGVLPLEDETALQDAKPVLDGKVKPDEAKIAAREKAMVARLPKEGFAVIVLGGSHDLGPYLPTGSLYVKATPRGYPED